MKRYLVTLITALAVVLVAAPPVQATSLSPDLLSWLDDHRDLDARTSVIVQLTEPLSDRDRAYLFEEAADVQEFPLLGMLAVDLPARELPRWAAHPKVRAISLDRPVKAMGPSFLQRVTGSEAAKHTYSVDGDGIAVAILDTGIDASHPDVSVLAGASFVPSGDAYQDLYGHGTHVASLATGKTSDAKEVGFTANGSAQKSKAVSVQVLDGSGQGQMSWVLGGVNWVLQNHNAYNIRVVNMSLGASAVESYKTDPLVQATRILHDAGIVVVTSAGNLGDGGAAGPLYGTITSPGISPWAITVGAANDHGTLTRSDDTVTGFSSRGPTRGYDALTDTYDNLIKPDLVAPGYRVLGAEASGCSIAQTYPSLTVTGGLGFDYMTLSGTSMAAAAVSGVVAQIIEANPAMTPDLVKLALMYSAQTLPGYSVFEQGSGLVNAHGAVAIAMALRGKPVSQATPGTVLLSPSEMPSPISTIEGEPVSWSQGYVLVQQNGSPQLVQAGGIIFSEGIVFGEGLMFAEGIVFGEGIIFSEGIVFGEGILFCERSDFSANGLLFAEGVGYPMTTDGYVDASAVLFAEAGRLGRGDLLDANAVLFAEGVIFSEGVIYAEDLGLDLGLAFVGQDALGQSIMFAEGTLASSDMLAQSNSNASSVLAGANLAP